MNTILQYLPYHRITIRFFAQSKVAMRHWIGAALRNNFLRVAQDVCDNHGLSLRQRLDVLPLPTDHFLYKQLCGGFPKGFFFDCSDLPYKAPGFVLLPMQVYSVQLVLIGICAEELENFLQALRLMFARGFGHPVVPLTIVDIHVDERAYTPPSLVNNDNVQLKVVFKTPLSLPRSTKNFSAGYQNKLNGFPSFYQLMHSLTYRIATLHLLYGTTPVWAGRQEMDQWAETFVAPAAEAMLLSAQLRYEKRYGTPKQGLSSVYVMGGYMGELTFDDVKASFLPVLKYACSLGLGADIQYGLGMVDVNEIHKPNKNHAYERSH